MYILTLKGELVEGQAITNEEAEIAAELQATEGLYAHSGEYISDRTRRRLVAYLMESFRLTRRKPDLSLAPTIAAPEPELSDEAEENEIGEPGKIQ